MWTIYKKQRKNTKIERNKSSRFIIKNELDKDYFQHDMAYGDFKDLNKKTVADNAWLDKTFRTAKNSKYVEYQRGLASMVFW